MQNGIVRIELGKGYRKNGSISYFVALTQTFLTLGSSEGCRPEGPRRGHVSLPFALLTMRSTGCA